MLENQFKKEEREKISEALLHYEDHNPFVIDTDEEEDEIDRNDLSLISTPPRNKSIILTI